MTKLLYNNKFCVPIEKIKIDMRFYFILIVQLLTLFSCNGQNAKKNNSERIAVQTDTFQTIKDENLGIVYFSMDNGNTWKNTSKGIPQNVRIGLGGLTSSGKLLAIATKENGIFVYEAKDSIWVNIPTQKGIIDGNLGAIIHYKNAFYIGTQSKGVFLSNDNGKNWKNQNAGLGNLTIRRFLTFDNKLYACTNNGFYLFDKKTDSWKLEYGENGLQVNGATMFQNFLYIATNKGIYRRDLTARWQNVLPNHSVHNISSDFEQLYGMTYTALLLSSKDGLQWQNIQNGLPKDLYTFNVLRQNDIIFAAQWDGVYKKSTNSMNWEFSSNGLPKKFAVTNLITFDNILVISTSERKLKENMTTKK